MFTFVTYSNSSLSLGSLGTTVSYPKTNYFTLMFIKNISYEITIILKYFLTNLTKLQYS